MKWNLLFVFFILCFINISCMPKRPPDIIENSIKYEKNETFLRIEVKTKYSPEQYSLRMGQVYFISSDMSDDRSLSPTWWEAEVVDDIFIIRIDIDIVNELMHEKEFVIDVLLYNEKRGREEMYLRSLENY